jgi:DNA-binding GntR family transcriptional regulator
LQDSLDQARGIPAKSCWERKAAAHAAFYTVLADAAGDPRAAQVLRSGARLACDLLISAGRSADFIVINSRERVLAHIRVGDTPAASAEMEAHLRTLHFIWRMVNSTAGKPRRGHPHSHGLSAGAALSASATGQGG